VIDSVGYIGLANNTNNVAIVTGAGSVWSNSAQLNVGYNQATGVQLIVTNGGTVADGFGFVGRLASSTNNSVTVMGAGSLWRSTLQVNVGDTASFTAGGGTVSVTDGGTLESPVLVSGFNGSGTISNRGGIYQFPTSAPTITANTANSIVITNGTISYRDVNGADIYNGEVAHMTFQGDNTFRLNNSSNASVASYTFDSVANTGAPTNYQRLALVNGGSRWAGGNVTIGTGGAMLVSNSAAASVSAVITNLGLIEVKNSKMTFEGNVVISGKYVSDPSTNTYLADVTVLAGGSLAGGAGDLFDFKKGLYIHSTNRVEFDLSTSTVQFSGGGIHTNAITGQDLGGGMPAYDASFATHTNFAYGTLRLGSTNDVLCFECGNIPVVASNALYIGYLDLTGLTNDIPNINTLVTSVLHAPTNINLYYQIGGNDAYLGGLTYQLTDCNNALGGLLLPVIPEPSTLTLLVLTACAILWRKSYRA
jgi:T5SS/PEP-CTERM-associated repeat protein